MQNREQLIPELFSHIKIFENKLRLWHTQLLDGNICHFPTVLQVLGDNISREKVMEFAHQIDCILLEFREQDLELRKLTSIYSCHHSIQTSSMHQL